MAGLGQRPRPAARRVQRRQNKLGNDHRHAPRDSASSGKALHRLSLLRSPALARGLLLLLVLGCMAGVFAMLPRVPGSAPLHAADELRAAHVRLEMALLQAQRHGGPEQTEAIAQAVGVLAHRLSTVRAEMADANLLTQALTPLEQQWQDLRNHLGRHGANDSTLAGAQALGRLAESLSASVLLQLDDRLDRLHLWLKVLGAALLLTLLVAVRALFAQRQRLRASLHQASDELGAGDWQGAVKTLREDRAGPSSAFDAFAGGVETMLGQSERRWQALADLSADWYWEADAEGRIKGLSMQPAFLASQDWTVADVLGRRLDQVPFFRAPTQGWHAFYDHLARRQPFRDLEFQVAPRRGNRLLWVSLSGRPQVDADGLFSGYEGVGRDVTERRDGQERLVASEQRWSMMVGLASDWYWETDTEHRVLPLRPELRPRYGALFDQLEGRTFWDAHRDALSSEQWADHRADMEAHRPFRGLELEVNVGEERPLRWVSLSGIPRFDAQKRFRGYHGVGRDITARKEAERLLLRHNESLQRAVAERTTELQQVNLDLEAFSRHLAHELRTPITHIQGLSSLLQGRLAARLSREESEMLGLQVQAARQMLATVEALMALARSTLAPLPSQAVDLSALAQECVAELPPTGERRAAVRWNIQPGLWVQGTRSALKIVLTNLLANAVKFTRTVADPVVSVHGEREGQGRLRVCVQDNGVGFRPEEAAKLFQPFSRLVSSKDYAGTGIGLTIAQRIIERHGGTIAARPAPGGGAWFEFVLDEAASPPQTHPPLPPPQEARAA